MLWSQCYWMEHRWIQCYNELNSTEVNVIERNISEFNVILKGISLRSMLLIEHQWIQCYNELNSTEVNVIECNISEFNVIFNGILLKSMLLNGTLVNLMFYAMEFHWRPWYIEWNISDQWIQCYIERHPTEVNVFKWNINEFNAVLNHPTELSDILNGTSVNSMI